MELKEELEKIWKSIKSLKENKVDVDTFETKIFEIEQELEGEEDISLPVFFLPQTLKSICAVLVKELEPLVRADHKEIAAAGSLVAMKNSLHEVQMKMNQAVLKEDLKKV